MIEEIKALMEEQGIDVFGTSDVYSALPERLQSTPYAITLGIRLSDSVMDEVRLGPTKNYFHHYRTANALLDMCALKCVIYLQRRGFHARAIPASQTTSESAIAADFQHKTAANLAGLGFIGKSGLFIAKDYGPRVRFATVLTDLKLETGKMQTPGCGECFLCADACPCGAISGNMWLPGISRDDLVDATLCSRYMKNKYKNIGRGAVCGICISVCPFGNKNPSEISY